MNRKPLVAGLLTCLLVIGSANAAGPRTVTDPQAPRALSGANLSRDTIPPTRSLSKSCLLS